MPREIDTGPALRARLGGKVCTMPDPGESTSFGVLYGKVVAQIVDGDYRPGDRIGVKDLADRLRVSNTPLREILSRLVGRGIVEERRAEGYYLPRFDPQDIGHLYQLHGASIERALGDIPRSTIPDPLPVDVWILFEQLVRASSNHILMDIQSYLAGRLALLRRCDVRLFGETSAEANGMVALFNADRRDDLRGAIRSFHRRRQAASAEIAVLLARGT